MGRHLTQPEIVRCCFDELFDARVPAMCLRWKSEAHTSAEKTWDLPEGMRLVSPAPERFGVSIRRHGADSYAVRLLWDRTCMYWPALTRRTLMASSLAPLLEAMGTDLWYLLDQPVAAEPGVPQSAA
jgi:hypothetical protein